MPNQEDEVEIIKEKFELTDIWRILFHPGHAWFKTIFQLLIVSLD